MTRILVNVGLALSYFPRGKHICAVCMVYQADLILFSYEREFMSNLHKSKQYDLIDLSNDTSQFLGDIFIIEYMNLRNIFLIYNF